MSLPGNRIRPALPLVAFLGMCPGPAAAWDCAKPKGQLQTVICADKDLRKAEEDMAKAYFATLLRAPDKEAHDLLQAAQRRWVASREEAWGGEPSEDDTYDTDDEALANVLREDTRHHVDFIRGFWGDLTKDRAFASEFTGGPYSGAMVSCGRAPPGFGDGYYFCTGYLSLQHHDRVCTQEIEWASNHDVSHRSVQRVGTSGLAGVATCNIGWGSGVTCPDSRNPAPDSGWEKDTDFTDRSKAGSAPGPKTRDLPKYAPDLGSFAREAGWMRECLTAKAYPEPGLFKPAPK